MVATGRKARSAKNRLSLSRVAVPVSLTGLPLPPGCAVTAKDVDELVHGESAQQQLCALKSIGTSSQQHPVLCRTLLCLGVEKRP